MSTRTGAEDDAPLKGVSVLVTRAPADAGALTERLRSLGASVVHLPAIAIEPPQDTGPLDDALRRLGEYDWIAFTSRNAVTSVLERLLGNEGRMRQEPAPATGPERGPGAGGRIPQNTRVAAVGPSTAAELHARGVAVDCAPAEATASDLVVAMAAEGVQGKRVLLPIGDIARPELGDGLERVGALVHRVVAYRTVQPLARRHDALDALRRGGVDAALLASPSAIRNLAAMLGSGVPVLQYVRMVCIGPTTAEAVRELGLEPAAVAREHTVDGLLAALVEMYDTERK